MSTKPELPPLPPMKQIRASGGGIIASGTPGYAWGHDPGQVYEFGLSCYRQAIEDAAQVIEAKRAEFAQVARGLIPADHCAAAIRADLLLGERE